MEEYLHRYKDKVCRDRFNCRSMAMVLRSMAVVWRSIYTDIKTRSVETGLTVGVWLQCGASYLYLSEI